MDKYDQILDLIEHPGNYSSQEIETLLADEEMREIYNLLCKTAGSLQKHEEVDVEAEWKAFCRSNYKKRFSALRPGSRAASIAALVCVAAAALAIGSGVVMKVISRNSAVQEEVVKASPVGETTAARTDTILTVTVGNEAATQVIFEDETLDTVLKTIAAHYRMELKYAAPASGDLHIYYHWNPELSVDEVLEQLNNFVQINLRREGNIIIVDKP